MKGVCSKQGRQALLSVIPRGLWSWTKGVPFCAVFAKVLTAISHAIAETSEGYRCLMDTENLSEHVATTSVTCGCNICQNTQNTT